MDSANESFTISSKETLLPINNQHPSSPKPTRNNKNLKSILLFSLLILVILISSSFILSSLTKKRQSKRLNLYQSSSTRYFCPLTTYRKLCYNSMSSIMNSTVLESGPGPIFSTSIRIAINQLNNVTISIHKVFHLVHHSTFANNSLVGPSLSKCQAWVNDSLSQLNESLTVLSVDSDIESLTYEEMDNMKTRNLAATGNVVKCLLELEDVIDVMMDGEEKMGVEEVKLGVEKARKYMVNSIDLLDRRESILFDFYNTSIEYDDDDYNYYSYYYNYYFYSYRNFDYRFMVFLYSVLYLFLALLYFLFWSSN